MADNAKSRLQLHLPADLREAAEAEAKKRFMSLTGLILYALQKEVSPK